ncbi:multidrug resistance protein 2 (heavy metal transport family) [Plasmodium sp. DRC-Itaito]|nr:multidrug resistance protein 2 (heavy metal transport family) [Plasmodium sp. DRC-Itaito]
MDVSNYEYLRSYGINNELKRKRTHKKIIIYHIVDIIIFFLLLFSCYNFNFQLCYKYEKSIFYNFFKSSVDLFLLNVIRIVYTIILFRLHRRITQLNALGKVYVISRHITGILAILNVIKMINYSYIVKSENPLYNTDMYLITLKVLFMVYSIFSSIYYYFTQFKLYNIKKKYIIARVELEKILINDIKSKKYNIYKSDENSGILGTDNNSTIMNNEYLNLDYKNLLDMNISYNKLNEKINNDIIKNTSDDQEKNMDYHNINNFQIKKKSSNFSYLNFFHKQSKDNKIDVKETFLNKTYSSKRSSKVDDSSSSNNNNNNINSKINYLENNITYAEFKKILVPYLWPSKRIDMKGNSSILRTYIVLIFLFILLSKIFSVISPIYLGWASNEVLKKSLSTSIYYLGLYVIFFFISKFLKEVCGVLYSQVQQSAFIELQESIFQTFHNLSYEWYSSKNSGGIMRIVDRGTESANNLMSSVLMYIIPATIEGIITCIIFIFKYKNSLLGSVLFIGLTLYIYSTIKITKWRKKIRTKANEMDNVYHDIAHDSLTNYENVKYFSNEKFEIKKFCNALSNYHRYNLKILNSLGILNTVQQFILNGTLFFTLLCVIYMIVKEGSDPGVFISVVVYTSNVFQPLSILGTLYATIIKSFTDISDLIDILRDKIDISNDQNLKKFELTSQEKKFGVSIEFNNVYFNYPTQPLNTSLKDINIYIKPGTTCALVGHTGSGKTTISKLLYRFYDSKGEIKIGGRNINEYTRNSIRNIIGIVPQDTILFNESIKYNILYGKLDATEEELTQAVKSAQLYDFIQSLPKKWDTLVGDKGVKLSGGERQRISIARCLLKDPKIVIFDEATSSLDSRTEFLFQKAVEDLRKNRTIIIIAHKLCTITTAELIILLNKGKIIERGTHLDLLKCNGEYTEMWNMQSKSNEPYNETSSSTDKDQDNKKNNDIILNTSKNINTTNFKSDSEENSQQLSDASNHFNQSKTNDHNNNNINLDKKKEESQFIIIKDNTHMDDHNINEKK